MQLVKTDSQEIRELLPPRMNSLNSQKTYGYHIAQFNRWIGGEVITFEKIKEYIETLEAEGYTAKSIQSKRDAIKRAVKDTFPQGSNIAFLDALDRAFKEMRVRTVKSRLDSSKVISRAEAEKLVSYLRLKNYRLALIVRALFSSGVRISELLSLRTKDVHLSRGQVSLRLKRKGGKEETLESAFSPELYEAIKKTFRPDKKGYFFRGLRSESYSRQYITRELRQATEKVLGIALSPHKLRHSHATELVSRGEPIDAIARRLGNLPETTARYYLHANIKPKTLKEVFL